MAGLFGRLFAGRKEPNAELKRLFWKAVEKRNDQKVQAALAAGVRNAEQLFFCHDAGWGKPHPVLTRGGFVEAALDLEAYHAMEKRMALEGAEPKQHLVEGGQCQRYLQLLRGFGVQTLMLCCGGTGMWVELENCAPEPQVGLLSKRNLPLRLALARVEQYRCREKRGAAAAHQLQEKTESLTKESRAMLREAVIWLRVQDDQEPGLYITPRALETVAPIGMTQIGEPEEIVSRPEHAAALQPGTIRLLEQPLEKVTGKGWSGKVYTTWQDACWDGAADADKARYVAVCFGELNRSRVTVDAATLGAEVDTDMEE